MSEHFDSTLGALFLGHFLSTILFGITSLQTWTYFKEHSKDPNPLRFLVFLLWILDCLHVALLTVGVYDYLVSNFGDLFAILKPCWSLSAIPVVTTTSTLIMRGIFAYRLWKLSGGVLLIPIFIVIGSLYTLGDATYFAIKLLHVETWFSLQPYSWNLYSGFGLEILVDGTITISQCILLRRLRTNIESRSINSVVQTLTIYSVNTCLVTSLSSIGCLVTFAALPNTFAFIAFYCILSKLYFNALLANLNARGFLQKSLNSPVHGPTGTATEFGTITTLEAAHNPDHVLFGPSDVKVAHIGGRNAGEVPADRSVFDTW